jgi:hypothetical protein
MAARSRPRGGQLKDEFDEERSLWNQIRADARRIDQLMVCFLSCQHSHFPCKHFFIGLEFISTTLALNDYTMAPRDLTKELAITPSYKGGRLGYVPIDDKTQTTTTGIPTEKEEGLWRTIQRQAKAVDKSVVGRRQAVSNCTSSTLESRQYNHCAATHHFAAIPSLKIVSRTSMS